MLILSASLGVLLGLSAATFYYAKGYSYLSSDPKACVNCHVMQPQYESWQRSSHHTSATCADCHMPHSFFAKYLTKMENGYLHSKAFTLQDYPDVLEIRDSSLAITNQACLHCHNDMTSQIQAHRQAAQGEAPTCSRCHSDVGH